MAGELEFVARLRDQASRQAEQLKRNLQGVRRDASKPINMTVGVDANAAQRTLAGLDRDLTRLQSRRTELPLQLQRVDGQISALTSQLTALQARRTTLPVELQGGVDRQISAIKAELGVLERKRIRIPLEIGNVSAQIGTTEAGIARVAASIGQLRAKAQSAQGPLRGVGDELDKLAMRSQRVQSASAQFGSLFKFQALAAGASLAGGAFASLTAGVFALGAAAAPAAGSLAGVGAAGVALGQGMAVARVALSGLDGAFKAQTEANAKLAAGQRLTKAETQKLAEELGRLSPAARGFVTEATQMQSRLLNIRTAVQGTLLPQLGQSINTLGTAYLPILNRAAVGTAGALRDIARDATVAFSSNVWRQDVQTILTTNVGLLRTLGGAAVPLANVMRNIWVAALPLAERFAGWVRSSSERVAALTQQARDSGALGRFFQLAGDTAAQLGRIVGNVATSLFNVGRAAFDSGRTLMTSLEGATARMREFTGSTAGAQRLREYFQNAVPVMQETGRLIGAVAGGIARLGENQALAPLIRQVREELVPAFGRLVSGVSTQFGPLLVQLATRVVDIFARLTAGGGGLNAFVGTLNNMAGAFQRLLASPLGPVVRDLLAFAGAAAAVGLAVGAVGRLTASIGLLGGGAIKAITALINFRGSMIALNAVMVANPIGAVVTAVAALAGGLVLAWRNSETFRDIVKRNFAAVGLAVADTADKYAGFLTALGRVPGFGWATDAARDLYGFAAAARDASTAALSSAVATDKANDSLSGVPGEADPARRSVDALKAAEDRLKGATQEATTQLNIFKGMAGDTTAASDGFKAALDRVRESVRQNGRSLDDNTEKGRANRSAILDAARALQTKMEADFKAKAAIGDVTGATRQATETFERNRRKLIDVAVQSGLTRKDAERYAGQLLKTPDEVRTAIETPGLTDAQREVDRLKTKINQVPNAKGVKVTTTASFAAEEGRPGRPYSGGLATGGSVIGPGTGTSDSIPARLSNGEHVWTAKEVRKAGGHRAVEALRQQVLRFAKGGHVGCGCSHHGGGLAVPGSSETGRFSNPMSQRRYDQLVKDREVTFTGGGGPLNVGAAARAWDNVADLDVRSGQGKNRVNVDWYTRFGGRLIGGNPGLLGRYTDPDLIQVFAGANWGRLSKNYTLKHEVGHAVGLSHSRSRGAMMYPSQIAGASPNNPTTEDKRRLRAAFPTRGDDKLAPGKGGPVPGALKLLGVNFPGSYTGSVSGVGDRIQQQYAATLAVAGNMAIRAVGGAPGRGPSPGRGAPFTGPVRGRGRAYGGVLPFVAGVGDAVQKTFGRMTVGGYVRRNIAGTRRVSDHGLGKALDFMTYRDKGKGQRIADFLVGNAGKFRADNVIFNRRIWSGGGWRPYRHPGGNNPTLNHEDHVHYDTFRHGGAVRALKQRGSALNPHIRDRGGPLLPGYTLNATGRPETVVPGNGTMTVRHVVEFRGAAPPGLTARDVADVIARDPRAAAALERTLGNERNRASRRSATARGAA